jgi:cation diffusion facilitator CzcD-associated flavoprotein CzcO
MTAAEPATGTSPGASAVAANGASTSHSTGASTGSDPAAAPGPAFPAGRHLRVAVIGAGFAGLAVAHRLRSVGIEDFVVLERGRTVGGTWRENTYPGCGCDIPSHLYSFSFAPNPSWSRSFSRQPEILRYLEGATRRLDLERHVVLDTEVTSSRWEDDAARWRVTTPRGELTADVLVGATGPLTQPRLPLVPGLAEFEGPVFHTARWRHDVDLTGRRVAVVGTGASAIQVVPELARSVDRLVLFQRTPPWVIPKSDRRITGVEQALYRRVPAAQRAVRAFQYTFRESGVPGFVFRPRLMAGGEAVARRHLHRTIKDPVLREQLTPDYRIGCKRILPSNDFYPALLEPNVELVPSALAAVRHGRAVAVDGSSFEVDAIVLGTGFDITERPETETVFGREGSSLSEVWARNGRSALRSTSVAGFPNLFLILGPNSGLGHNSMVYVIESQAAYVVDAVQAIAAGRLAAVEPTERAQGRWSDAVQRRMAGTVWQNGGCASWYQDPDGRNTALWPGFTFRFRSLTRHVDLGEYERRPVDPGIAVARAARPSGAAVRAGGTR